MKTVRIAFRNIFRNTRRSLMTVLAISVSSVSILLFGGFVNSIRHGLQTGIVQNTGHLHVYTRDFFDYGSGNPAAYGISHYDQVIAAITRDPQLRDRIAVITPILKIYGIAGNFEAEASKTFFGLGVVPSDRDKMREWNEYHLENRPHQGLGLFDDDPEGGVIGCGMARMLRLDTVIEAADRRDRGSELTTPPRAASRRRLLEPGAMDAEASDDFSDLVAIEARDRQPASADQRPRLDLLAATAAGAPNVVTLYINRSENQGIKEMDDNFVAMHLALAQRLLYGKGEKKATGIVLQLRHTRDIPAVERRLREVFAANQLDFEIKDFTQLSPAYGQILAMFGAIFTFLALIMGVIVLFTIINTMSMSVMERVNEIGTVRALGVRRAGVLRQFLTEGCLLGMLGATIGSLAATVIAIVINAAAIPWTPPNRVEPVFLTLHIFQTPAFIPMTWLVLTALAIVSASIPARKAARMTIVDALRHI